jgi:hypothetical protein
MAIDRIPKLLKSANQPAKLFRQPKTYDSKQNAYFVRMNEQLDAVGDLKRFCLFQCVKQNWGHLIRLNYQESIVRLAGGNYILLTHGKSSVLSLCCKEMVYFEFSEKSQNVRPVCSNQSCR